VVHAEKYCIAQYDYEATATNQISLREGDTVEIVSRSGEATGWWKGNNHGRVNSQPVIYFSSDIASGYRCCSMVFYFQSYIAAQIS